MGHRLRLGQRSGPCGHELGRSRALGFRRERLSHPRDAGRRRNPGGRQQRQPSVLGHGGLQPLAQRQSARPDGLGKRRFQLRRRRQWGRFASYGKQRIRDNPRALNGGFAGGRRRRVAGLHMAAAQDEGPDCGIVAGGGSVPAALGLCRRTAVAAIAVAVAGHELDAPARSVRRLVGGGELGQRPAHIQHRCRYPQRRHGQRHGPRRGMPRHLSSARVQPCR